MSGAPLAPLPTVGFLGLGAMGVPIAGRILAGGYPLVVYNRTAEKAEPLVAQGARLVPAPRDVGRAASGGIVFTLLTDGPTVRRALLGRGGAAFGAQPGTLFVDLSTISPEESRAIGGRLAARGLPFVDAPLGGSVDAAAEGRLLIYAGGSEPDVARARPVLERFSRRVEHLGPTGAGAAMKLVNNLLTLGHVALAAEALAFAEGVGLDRARTIAVLLDGGGQSRMLESKRAEFETRRYPAKFRLALAEKDARLIEREARRVGRPVRLGREVHRLLKEAEAAGLADADFSAMLEAALSRGRSGGVASSSPGPAPSVDPA
jgi:3-hydroxyisobutyrate dehydrogenase-like beta-hydroxyacid dehydrogenase